MLGNIVSKSTAAKDGTSLIEHLNEASAEATRLSDTAIARSAAAKKAERARRINATV